MPSFESLCKTARDSVRAHVADILDECSEHLRENRTDTPYLIEWVLWLAMRYNEQSALLTAVASTLSESE